MDSKATGQRGRHRVGHGGGGRVRGIDELEKTTSGQGRAISGKEEKGGGGSRAGLRLGRWMGRCERNRRRARSRAPREGWGKARPMRQPRPTRVKGRGPTEEGLARVKREKENGVFFF